MKIGKVNEFFEVHPSMKENFARLSAVSLGLFLLLNNLWGEYTGMRVPGLETATLRFQNDISYNYDEAMQLLSKTQSPKTIEELAYLNHIVSGTLAHIPWYEEKDPTRFNQLVPFSENFMLNIVGNFSNIPEFRKYHFTNYKRSLERGIGICGDASMVLSQILSEKGLNSRIVSLDSHVVVEAKIDGKTIVADPDFGVILPFPIESLSKEPGVVTELYAAAGYTKGDVNALNAAYSSNAVFWRNTKEFMTNKYYFERLSYVLKWVIPISLILVGMLFSPSRVKLGNKD